MVKDFKNFKYNPKKESIVIAGETQSGKSEWTKTLAHINAFSGYNVLVVDRNWIFTNLNPEKVIHTISDIKGKGLQILQPQTIRTGKEKHDYINNVCYVAQSFSKKGNFILIIDELQDWIEHFNKKVDGLDTYIHTCHNYNSSYIVNFQSPSEIPKYVFSNAIHKFCLYMDTPNNVKFMKNYVGNMMDGFSNGTFAKYEGFYKQSGQAPEKFKVVKFGK